MCYIHVQYDIQLARERAESGASPVPAHAAESGLTAGVSSAIHPLLKASSPDAADNATAHPLPPTALKPSNENGTLGTGIALQSVLSPPQTATTLVDGTTVYGFSHVFHCTMLILLIGNKYSHCFYVKIFVIFSTFQTMKCQLIVHVILSFFKI